MADFRAIVNSVQLERQCQTFYQPYLGFFDAATVDNKTESLV